MRYVGNVLGAALLVVFLAGPLVASAEPPSGTLKRLKSEHASERYEAALTLGQLGEMKHAPLLAGRLKDRDEVVRDAAYAGLWKIWMRSGDPDIDIMMKRGVALMNSDQPDKAVAVFSEMIRLKPAYAEGWNKRATALYMANRFHDSIADCLKVLALNPHHFGAASGMGMNYLGLDNFEGALDAFKQTLKIIPYSKSTARYIEMLESALAGKRKKI